ncbi:MAG: hypothetical protein ISS72_06905 [Candidatus Brocadiae bacterium]|nr:hypothetical protein [Candidatus Brocadiia bacterium]
MEARDEADRKLGMSHGMRHVVACAALVLLTVGVFSSALENEFVNFDDWPLIENNGAIRSLSWPTVGRAFTHLNNDTWLPLRMLSYAVDYEVWGLNAFGYHLTNIALHSANVVLVYAVLLRLVGGAPLAWLGAALFAVHPVQVEAVSWAAGRRDVLYGCFFLWSLLAFLWYEEGRRWRRGAYVASVLLFAAAMLSKASGMMLPAVLGLIVLLSRDEKGTAVWRRLRVCVPHGLVAAAMVAVHFHVAQQAGVVKPTALGQRVASMPWAFATYWRLLFLPVHLSTPHARPPVSWADEFGVAVASLAAFVAVLALVWWSAPLRRTAVLWLGWWFLLLLPVSQIIPLSMLVAERYLYMPIVGACAFGAALLGDLAKARRRLVVACAVAVLALMAVTTHARNRVWANSREFWHDGVAKWPGAPVPRIGLAAVYIENGSPLRAWRLYMDVLLPGGTAWSERDEHRSLVRQGMLMTYDRVGRRLERRGRSDEALAVYERTASVWPRRVDVHARLAEAYERRGMREAAHTQVARARGLYEEQRENGDEAFRTLVQRYPWVDGWMKRREGGPVLR